MDMNRIQKLEEELRKLQMEEAEIKKEKYKHFVGKCVHDIGSISYEKITGIKAVETQKDGSEKIDYERIVIYFDNSGGDSDVAIINMPSSSSAYADDLEENITTQEAFNKVFEDCIALIKRRMIV